MRTIARMLILAVLLGTMTVVAMGGPRVQLTIRGGRVWLTADGATAAEILTEWARVGQTAIANGERVPSGPLTLQLDGVPDGPRHKEQRRDCDHRSGLGQGAPREPGPRRPHGEDEGYPQEETVDALRSQASMLGSTR